MKDFPMFTTEYGVASLVLKEIPYQQTAYIIIRDSTEPEKLLEECVSFCRVCGAEQVCATGHKLLEQYSLYTALWEMRCLTEDISETDAALFPVQEHTLEDWRSIYNDKIRRVPNGAWMTQNDALEMLRKGEGYFIHRGDTLLGIGKVSGDVLEWVASVQPGAGQDVVCALAHATTADTITLTVAYNNEKAVKLYKGMGFVPVREISRWYIVYKNED